MEEVSNRTIAALLVVAMVVSLSGTFFSLSKLNMLQGGITGYAAHEQDAIAQLEIQDVTSIVFDVATVNWGSGSVNTSDFDTCNLSTRGISPTYPGCSVSTFNEDLGPLVLRNNGNQNVSVTLAANETPDSWISGGADLGPNVPAFQFQGAENKTGACAGGSLTDSLTDLSTGAELLCDQLDFSNVADALNIELFVVVPYDADIGAKSVTITAEATAT